MKRVLIITVFVLCVSSAWAVFRAVQFDGTSGHGTAADVSAYQFADHDFTLEAIVRLDNYPPPNTYDPSIIMKQAVLGGPGFTFEINTATQRFHFGGYGAGSDTEWNVSSDATILTDSCYHLSAVRQGSLFSIYVNGEPAGSGTWTIGSVNNDSPLGTGWFPRTAGRFFPGSIDEVRVWNDARTADEILSVLFVELAGNESNLVGLWQMDETSGSQCLDSSPTGNPANLFGGYSRITDVCADTKLPVELLSASATSGDEEVTIRWTTASESGIDRFDLDRDGQSIAQITAIGNSGTAQDYSWVDVDLENGRQYVYSLFSVDLNGTREHLETMEATPESSPEVPWEISLSQNYPNPFNPETVISFETPMTSHVVLQVFDLNGRVVSILVDGQLQAGSHQIQFSGAGLASGIYFYRLSTGYYVDTKKMILMR